jgi:hypothetical protein
MATSNATQVDHWPGQDAVVCDKHLEQLVGLAGVMGFTLSWTPVVQPTKCGNCETEAKKNRRWVRDEAMDKLCLEGTGVRNVHKDALGTFWFNDETESQVFGPFDTAQDASEGCGAYAKTI